VIRLAVVHASAKITAAELDRLKKDLARSLGIEDLIWTERWPNPHAQLTRILQEERLPLRNILGRL
jgi:hypothetical protein